MGFSCSLLVVFDAVFQWIVWWKCFCEQFGGRWAAYNSLPGREKLMLIECHPSPHFSAGHVIHQYVSSHLSLRIGFNPKIPNTKNTSHQLPQTTKTIRQLFAIFSPYSQNPQLFLPHSTAAAEAFPIRSSWTLSTLWCK